MDRMLHPQEATHVYRSFYSQFMHLIRNIYISIVARLCWQKWTSYMCIFFILNIEEHRNCFLKTCVVRNSCSKGNIDRSKNVLAETNGGEYSGRTNLSHLVFPSFLQQLPILTNNDIFLYTTQMLPCWISWLNNQMQNSPGFLFKLQ